MYSDVLAYCNKCPECVVVTGAGHHHWPPLHPIIIHASSIPEHGFEGAIELFHHAVPLWTVQGSVQLSNPQ